MGLVEQNSLDGDLVEQDVSKLTQAVWVNHRGATQWSRTQLSQAWRRLTADVGGGGAAARRNNNSKEINVNQKVNLYFGGLEVWCGVAPEDF